MTRHLEAIIVMTGRHDASPWGLARHDSRLLTDALDGVDFTIKFHFFLQTTLQLSYFTYTKPCYRRSPRRGASDGALFSNSIDADC